MTPNHQQLVLSGMQPTNTLHLGNYLGALKNWVKMQAEMPCLFCVVDMHSLTDDAGYRKPEDVARASREVTAAYIAAGVDPRHTPIFAQSMVASIPNSPGSSTASPASAGSTA
jgi:tryptophanyl-tRNA synthetase